MTIIDGFEEEEVTLISTTRENIVISGGREQSRTTAPVLTNFKSIFYKGGQSKSIVAEKIRAVVDATLIVRIGTDILKNDEVIVIATGAKYDVIDIDDVGNLGEALVIPLKEKT